MRLTSVRVRNFKSVEDSQPFNIGDVTCLVGKNESGKSALLQALYKLRPDIDAEGSFNDVQEYPRRRLSQYQARRRGSEDQKPDNVLTTEWVLDDDDVAAVETMLGAGSLSNRTVTIKKGYDNIPYWTTHVDEAVVVQHYLDSYLSMGNEKTALQSSRAVAELLAALERIDSPSTEASELLIRMREHFSERRPSWHAMNILSGRLPTILYFGEYYRLSGQVSVNDILQRKATGKLRIEDRLFLALLDLAGTTLEALQDAKQFEEFVANVEAISNRISDEIFAYWSQNKHLEVRFSFDQARPGDPVPFNSGYVFRTRIYNARHRVTVGFDERSTGFVWFFSFLVWFSQVQETYGDNVIILLDEPGLSLHAKAQADLLRYIDEQLAPKHQVIYTTHSPFMIAPDDLSRVRTVEDVVTDGTVEGTKVSDQFYRQEADTLFPLQAALGYDITQSLFVGKHTLLVEGPSDLLYLKWFSAELLAKKRARLDPRWVIAPTGGIDKVRSFVALFKANRLTIAALTDFHHGDKQKVRNLRGLDVLSENHLLTADMYAGQSEADTEDIIGRDLYVALINACYGLKGKQALPTAKPATAPARVVAEVEAHFAALPASVPEFDHFTPSPYLLEHGADMRKLLPAYDQALDRFEKLFADLNSLL